MQVENKPSTLEKFLYSILSSVYIKVLIIFLYRTGGTKMNASKNEQNRMSTSGPLHLNPMDILRNVFTSRISSRFVLTVVWILIFNPLIYCHN